MNSTNIRISIWFLVIALASLVACTVQEVTPIGSELASVERTPTSDEITTLETAEPAITPSISPTPTSELATPAATEVLPTPTPSPMLSVTPTVVTVEERLVYENDFLGYRFSYPPQARIHRSGVDLTEEFLEYLTEQESVSERQKEFLKQYEGTRLNDLCVSVQYGTGFVIFAPPSDIYSPCGITGVGDYDIINVKQAILIGDEPYTASGFKLYEQGSDTWQGEFYILRFDDRGAIHYGNLSGTEEQFLDVKDLLLQIVTSFRFE
jgi:hypothetical protein